MRKLSNIIWFWIVFASPIVFIISVIVTFLMVDRPIHITCSGSNKVCSAYTLKLSTMFYHGMRAAKLEHTNPEASKKHADIIKKNFEKPTNTFLISDVKGYTCRKIYFDAMSKYKSYILLKNGKKVILGQHQSIEQCKQACNSVNKDIKNWNYSKNITLVAE